MHDHSIPCVNFYNLTACARRYHLHRMIIHQRNRGRRCPGVERELLHNAMHAAPRSRICAVVFMNSYGYGQAFREQGGACLQHS